MFQMFYLVASKLVQRQKCKYLSPPNILGMCQNANLDWWDSINPLCKTVPMATAGVKPALFKFGFYLLSFYSTLLQPIMSAFVTNIKHFWLSKIHQTILFSQQSLSGNHTNITAYYQGIGNIPHGIGLTSLVCPVSLRPSYAASSIFTEG